MISSFRVTTPGLFALIRRQFRGFDLPLTLALCLLLILSTVAMYSAGMGAPGRLEGHLRNMMIAFSVIWITASIPLQAMMRAAVPLYVGAIGLLVAVAAFGIVKKGSRRWIDVGIVIQPSELLKIALPLMLAWYFHRRGGIIGWKEFCIAGVLLVIPFLLIAKQPDLGTAILVGSAGFFVIFFAGLPWKALGAMLVAALASLPVAWSLLHDYQRDRVMMLLDPTADPLGRGYHIIQSMTAIGSGGIDGKGWTKGTQTHLDFIPERTSDFLFATYSEEFGFMGNAVLLLLYLFIIGRGLLIAANAPTLFSRLLAGAIALSFFTYAFVNMGMVSGMLPVVGVPLPFMSYGGTAFVTLGVSIGILMGIQRQRANR
jgi:rod shape determining protein RodA